MSKFKIGDRVELKDKSKTNLRFLEVNSERICKCLDMDKGVHLDIPLSKLSLWKNPVGVMILRDRRG